MFYEFREVDRDQVKQHLVGHEIEFRYYSQSMKKPVRGGGGFQTGEHQIRTTLLICAWYSISREQDKVPDLYGLHSS